ncbi:hypothetical protein F441_00418 [Phytophthora nicotianae CJ01A1]|nr:hypothetical protein L916_00394 [Phytophthora nicotianae]ETP27019.1 hypothetical protein F441_00418 [Phytophthora nicotianae CJ01A1]
MEATILCHTTRTTDICDLLTRVHIKDKPPSEMQFMKLIGLEPEYDAEEEFSSNAFAL